MPVPNLVRVVMHYSGYSEEGAISWHFDGLGAKSEDNLSALLDNIDGQLSDTGTTPTGWEAAQSFISTQQNWDQLSIYQYAVSTGPATGVAHKAISGHAGTAANIYGGLQVAAVLSTHTGAAGRSNNGRQYWPGFARQATTATALWDNFSTDAMGSNALLIHGCIEQGLRESPGDDAAQWGVYSRTRDTLRHITSVSMDNRPDTQRRRAESLRAGHSYSAPVSRP